MQPIASVWGELPRAVRDLAGSLGKEVTLRLEGDDTELDRGLIEPLREVLLHLVRNALDHGIEDSTVREAAGKSPAGVLRIAAQPSAGEVLITVEDDGRGINLETIRRLSVERGILTGPEAAQVSDTGLLDIIFQPGFSTRSSVSATSGRGVGMDVVRSSVEQIGGKVSITTEAGRGTSITMRLPTTLVGVPVLVVRVGELLYGITRSCVLSILDERSWGMVAGSRVVRFNEEVLPTVNIGRAMGVPTASEGKAAIVCEVEGNRGAFVVDAAVDYTELVVKKLDPLLNPAGIYSGGGVLGDGKLVVLLDVQGFLKKHGPELRAVPATMDPVALVDAPVDTATNVLLCRGESGLMAIDTVKVERVVGLSEVESRVLRYGVMEFESSLLQVVDTLGNPLSSLEGFAALILLAASNARTKTAVAVREVIDIERLPIESVDDSIENQAGDTIISTTWGPVALLPQLNAIVGETVT
jgi:two-component system chemotaxis sensor kinase CheA